MNSLESSIVATLIISIFIIFFYQGVFGYRGLAKNMASELNFAGAWTEDSPMLVFGSESGHKNVQTQPERLIYLLDLLQDLARIAYEEN